MSDKSHPGDQSQLVLLRSRRFLPFFLVQFTGAFNDNLYKNALLLLIAFSATSVFGLAGDMLMNIAAGLFILPFFLFSALAGQIADKYEKSRLIRLLKLAEVLIMAAGAWALWQGWYEALLVLLFVMGAQSAFFGPVKYSILPQVLRNAELVGGNALVEMGTIAAGLLMEFESAARLAAGGVLAVAVLRPLAQRSS
jgi:MFS family permease